MHRLPGHIAAVMVGTILIFVVTLGAFMLWMSRALDNQAWQQSVAQVEDVQESMLDQIRLTTFDWAKWELAVQEVDAANLDWINENLGNAIATGQVFQLAAIWGGRYEEDLGWATEVAEQGYPGLLDPATLALVESHMASIPIGAFEAAQFFIRHEGSVYAMAAARLEYPPNPDAPTADDDELERLLLGRRVSEEALVEVADSFRLANLRLVRDAPEGSPSVPLLGGTGEPVAHLTWDAPHPGSVMLGRMLPVVVIVTLLAALLTLVGMVLVRRNAQNLVLAEQQASSAARTDSLTGLPNRAAFGIALSEPAAAGERAVVFLDVNGFKRINDSLGHEAGDELIVSLARRLERLTGPGCLLARIGGDEFIFVLTGPKAALRAGPLAQSAQSVLVTPFDIQGHRMRVRAAIGYAVQDSDDIEGEDLVRQADLAMYRAKRQEGRGPVAFDELIREGGHDAAAVERALREALHRPGELWMAYQPLVAADGRTLARAEALARWTSPELGPVRPDNFIAVAERAGLIIELGRRLLQLVLDDLAAQPTLRVSVNISSIQLMAPDFVPDLLDLLQARGIAPDRVQVELTESVLVDDPVLAARRVRALHEAGISTALDDFGTGFSSIATLRQMQFDTIKIDRSFVAGLDGEHDRLALVNAMILLGHAMGLRVVCEGVETKEELGVLRELGCDLIQGYLIDRPLPVDTLAARWLRTETQAVA